MTTTTALDLDAIKARTDAATGPRLISGHKSWAGENAVLTDEGHPVAVCGTGDAAAKDAEFFAAARQDVPALVSEVERLRDQISRARDALTEYGRNAMDVSGDLEDGINAERLMAADESGDDCGCTYCRALGSHARPLTDNERAFQDGV